VTGQTVRYAGFWRRFAAFLLDYILFSSLLFLIIYMIHGADYSPTQGLLTYVLWPVVIVVFWLKMAATPGKLLLGCRVVDAATLRPLSVGQALLRLLGYLISLMVISSGFVYAALDPHRQVVGFLISLFLTGFGFVYAAVDPRKQGVHDKMARTVVVVEDEADSLLREWGTR
jgi:uncharacterized RDD family membrane protein YckC